MIFIFCLFLPGGTDLLLACELDQLKPEAFALVDFAPYPQVLAWIDRLRTALPPSVYDDVYAPVVAIAQKIKAAKKA